MKPAILPLEVVGVAQRTLSCLVPCQHGIAADLDEPGVGSPFDSPRPSCFPLASQDVPRLRLEPDWTELQVDDQLFPPDAIITQVRAFTLPR